MQQQLLPVLQNQTLGPVNNGFQIFLNEAELILSEFPRLTLDAGSSNSVPSISGTIQLNDEKGSIIDGYQIKIIPTTEYPFRFAHVFETGGRIPINIDWHIYPDGHCCIRSIPEEILICRKGINLHGFINDQLKPYFFNQKYREIHGYYLNERPHGTEGNFQFFSEAFRTTDAGTIVNGLDLIKQRNEPNRVSECFCGSGLKYRKCHRDTFRLLNAFTNDELNFFIEMIMNFGQNQK